MKPQSAIYNSLILDGALVGQNYTPDTNKPLMSAECLDSRFRGNDKDFPEVDDMFWVREYRRGEWPALCYEN